MGARRCGYKGLWRAHGKKGGVGHSRARGISSFAAQTRFWPIYFWPISSWTWEQSSILCTPPGGRRAVTGAHRAPASCESSATVSTFKQPDILHGKAFDIITACASGARPRRAGAPRREARQARGVLGSGLRLHLLLLLLLLLACL